MIVFEPFYENYGADALITGATPRYVTLRERLPDGYYRQLAADYAERRDLEEAGRRLLRLRPGGSG